MKLTNIKKSLQELSQLLVQNSNIIQLLYNDNADALDHPITIPGGLDYLINNKYITFYPPVDNITDSTRNTFLIVLLDSVSIDNDNLRGNITIYVTTDINHVLLTKNRNRLLELSDEVINTLDNVKLTSAGKINITSLSHVMLNEFRAGYRIVLNFADQTNDQIWL